MLKIQQLVRTNTVTKAGNQNTKLKKKRENIVILSNGNNMLKQE